MTQKQIGDLGLMIIKMEDCAAIRFGEASKSGNVREAAILEELSWMIDNVKTEFKLGNFAEARTLYENAEWLLNRSIKRMNPTDSVTYRNNRIACDIATMTNFPLPNTEIMRIRIRMGKAERTLYPDTLEVWSPRNVYREVSYFGGEGEVTVEVVRHDFNVTDEDMKRGSFIWDNFTRYKLDIETIKYN